MNNQSKFRILLVDDEKSNLDVLNHILKMEHDILIAKSGEDALEIAEELLPDLILLDILMPGKSGFDVLIALKEMDATRDIPVIFITGLSGVDDEEKGLFLGAVDYITKPFKHSIVKARVKTHLKIVKQMRTIENLGMIDALTDIPNRRSYDARIAAEWQKAITDRTPLSLLMIDIDNFKVYNDTYGHPQGDTLLQTLAQTLVNSLPSPDAFVARLGGEEFVVILPDTDLERAAQIAETIRTNVEATTVPLADCTHTTRITVSVGVASTMPCETPVVTDLISVADLKLYAAKGAGRNKIEF